MGYFDTMGWLRMGFTGYSGFYTNVSAVHCYLKGEPVATFSFSGRGKFLDVLMVDEHGDGVGVPVMGESLRDQVYAALEDVLDLDEAKDALDPFFDAVEVDAEPEADPETEVTYAVMMEIRSGRSDWAIDRWQGGLSYAEAHRQAFRQANIWNGQIRRVWVAGEPLSDTAWSVPPTNAYVNVAHRS